MMRKSGIVLEDKEIFDTNKIHRNVLKPVPKEFIPKSRVYNDPSEEDPLDDIRVDPKILAIVTENLRFDKQVIKSKAQHTLSYSPSLTQEVFERRVGDRALLEANKHRIPNALTRLKQLKKKLSLTKSRRLPEKKIETKSENVQDAEEKENDVDPIQLVKAIEPKFTPLHYFRSASDGDLSDSVVKTQNNANKETTKSLEDVNRQIEGFFLTEDPHQQSEWDWDCQLIDELSENTARWLVMKRMERDVKQKEKLISIIEEKFGRYTRELSDLDLFEDSLTEYEKQKIREEKDRLKQEKEQRKLKNETTKIKPKKKIEEANSEEKPVPLYRLPQGLKRIELEKLKMPDPNYNSTARNLDPKPIRVETPETYHDKMIRERGISNKTLLKSENAYVNEMLTKTNKHSYTTTENEIILKNGLAFKKDIMSTYPAQFTEWVSNVDLTPADKPYMKKPTKGKKRWKNLPQLIVIDKMNKPVDITTENNYWHLMPTTADTELRKVLGSNLTVAKIIEEWRKKWQTSSRWNQVDIDELLADLKDQAAHVRFQALVVCSRAIENRQQLRLKLGKQSKQFSAELLDETDEIGSFGESLFNAIVSLLGDMNYKCRLAASIAVFTWLRYNPMPLLEYYQINKDRAECLLRESLNGINHADKFTAALCLSTLGRFCDESIVEVLLHNYFISREQYTREQVVRSLAYLSEFHPLVMTGIGKYLSSEHSRKRIMACKLLPCMHVSISQEITNSLVEIMWNDISRQARKVAAQTLGRTGRGKCVHDEVLARLGSPISRNRVEALQKINYVGIMTSQMLEVFLKCFRDDYTSVRELACTACQSLVYDKNDEKIIEALVHMVRFERAIKLKALAIRTLGLIGDSRAQIRNCLLWAVQFENEALIRTEACHSLVVLIGDLRDKEIIDILIERNFVEEVPIVKKEIRDALIYFGHDPNKELPIVTKIKADIKKLNDKKHIIERIYEMEKEEKFEIDKKILIGEEEENYNSETVMFKKTSLEIFQPKHITNKQESRKKKPPNPNLKRTSFLSKLVSSLETTSTTKPTEMAIDVSRSPTSSASPSISINISPNGGGDSPDFVDESKTTPPTIKKTAQLDVSNYLAKSSTSSFIGGTKQIDTILEETNY